MNYLLCQLSFNYIGYFEIVCEIILVIDQTSAIGWYGVSLPYKTIKKVKKKNNQKEYFLFLLLPHSQCPGGVAKGRRIGSWSDLVSGGG